MKQETYIKYYHEVPKQIFDLCRVFETRSRLALFIMIIKEHPITFDKLQELCNYTHEHLSDELVGLMICGVIECIGELSEEDYKQYYQPTTMGTLLMKKLYEAVLFIEHDYDNISVEDLIIYNCEKYGAYGSGGGMSMDADGKLHKTNRNGDKL
jgi:hypothetical protein